MHYFRLGGIVNHVEIDAWLHHALDLPTMQRNLLAQALAELADGHRLTPLPFTWDYPTNEEELSARELVSIGAHPTRARIRPTQQTRWIHQTRRILPPRLTRPSTRRTIPGPDSHQVTTAMIRPPKPLSWRAPRQHPWPSLPCTGHQGGYTRGGSTKGGHR